MEAILIDLVQRFPVLSTVLLIVGGLRVVLKPLMVYLEEHVASTPCPEDDEKLKKIKSSKWYRVLNFVLDYSASVKLPK